MMTGGVERTVTAAKRIALFAVVAFALSTVDARADWCLGPNSEETWFEGVLGAETARLLIMPDYRADPESPTAVYAVLIFPKYWSPFGLDSGDQKSDQVALEGTLGPGCELGLHEVVHETVVWKVAVRNGRLTGIRMTGPGVSEQFTLAASRPPDCGLEGPWRRFSQPDWPITFSYPPKWTIAVKENDAAVACPDAEMLETRRTVVWLTQGSAPEVRALGGPDTESAETGQFFGTLFLKHREQWFEGNVDFGCDESTPFCGPVRHSRRYGMDVFSGTQGEYRMYRTGGGYVGLSGLIAYLFVVPSGWVELNTGLTPNWVDIQGEVQRAGTGVPFDGDGITERIVRSIRPRPNRPH